MQFSTFLVAAFAAASYAAPVYPQLNMDAADPKGLQCMSDYFNLLASKVQASKFMTAAPVCDLSRAQMPSAPQSLPAPSKGLVLKHVAIGRGTQNYTCDANNATAIPAAAGAVATLFNASCVAASYPDLLHMLPRMSMQFDLTGDEKFHRMGPSNLAISGTHFFTNKTTPFFSLNTETQKLGEAPCAKNSSVPAPFDPATQAVQDVPWLKLLTNPGATGDLQEVYRLVTAGGSAPATCKDMPATFEVQYAAQYWFFQGPSPAAPAA